MRMTSCGRAWPAREPVRYRRNVLDHVNGIEQIHPRELVSLLAEIRAASPAWMSKDDLFRKALDRLSIKRRQLTMPVRATLDAALEAAERRNAGTEDSDW